MRWNKGRRNDRRDGQIIDHGLVWCPPQGKDVSVERCLSCGAYQDIVEAGELELLVCRPGRSEAPSIPLAL